MALNWRKLRFQMAVFHKVGRSRTLRRVSDQNYQSCKHNAASADILWIFTSAHKTGSNAITKVIGLASLNSRTIFVKVRDLILLVFSLVILIFWSIVAAFIGAAFSFVSKECLRLLWKVVKRLSINLSHRRWEDDITTRLAIARVGQEVSTLGDVVVGTDELRCESLHSSVCPSSDVQTKCSTF